MLLCVNISRLAVGCCELWLRSTPRYRLVCICFPTPGRCLHYGSGLGLSRCLGPGECRHSFIHTCLHVISTKFPTVLSSRLKQLVSSAVVLVSPATVLSSQLKPLVSSAVVLVSPATVLSSRLMLWLSGRMLLMKKAFNSTI